MVYKLGLVASPQIGLPSQGYEQGNQLGGCWKKPWVICGMDHNGGMEGV